MKHLFEVVWSSEGGILIDVRQFERVICYFANSRLLEDIYNLKTQNGGLLFVILLRGGLN